MSHKKLTDGIRGLLASRKGMLCLLILAIATVALFCGKLEGIYYAAIIGTIGTIYTFVQSRVDMAAMPYQSTYFNPYGYQGPVIGTPDAPMESPHEK